tara:strand:+ start:77 stop:877 length:801 start_codon:yes stop_codon:yes gene_type:complete
MKRRIPDLGKLLFVLPNLFTLSSVLCGFYAITTLTRAHGEASSFINASLAIVFAGFFDGMDGRVARLTRTQTDFGVQLDSLADLISFGVAPALLVHEWALSGLGWPGLIASFTFLAAGAARLARFNVMSARGENPSNVFVGLSIPLAAVAVISLVVACIKLDVDVQSHAQWVALYIVLLSFLQVSTVRFRSFKTLKLSPLSVFGLTFGLVAPIAVALALGQPWLMLIIFTVGYIVWGLIEHAVWMIRGSSVVDESEASSEPVVEAS